MTPEEELTQFISTLPYEEQLRMLELVDEVLERRGVEAIQRDFLKFILRMQPDYLMGVHLKRLGGLLMAIESGLKDRILVNVAPRHGKSQMISIYFPAWYLGRHPEHKVIMASHTADLAVDMSRKVRNIMQTAEYKSIFPGVQIASDAKAAGKWNTNRGGEFYACGVGGALAGRGAHLLLIDDPFSEQDVIGGNYDVFDKVYEWYAYGARTRLMPNGKIAILHCLVGSTRVMLADGSEKPLRDVRPNDMVASYEKGRIQPAKVLNWANQGLDHIFTIALKSGNVIRGNERHPFLVSKNGVESWVKIKDLKPGMMLVATKGTTATKLVKSDHFFATHATSLSKTETVLTYSNEPLSTLSIMLDEITSITLDTAQEDVFDIQVEGTENFLANGVVSHNTRWSQKDLTARLIKDGAMNPKSDQFELFEFPAILNEGEENEKPLFPEMWSLESLLRTKASMPLFQWNAQFMQSPTNADAAIVPKDWFQIWTHDDPPEVDFVVMALDAAVKSGERNDYNALTTWGVWENEENKRTEIILLNVINRRMDFPQLKDLVLEEYNEWEPDSLIIEDTANGAPLIQEFRLMGIPLQSFKPHRGSGDKAMRLSSVADMIRDKMVWVPQTRWAEELVEQVASFPSGDHDDLCDSMYLALRRIRQGGFVRLSTDEKDTDYELPARNIEYY